MTIKDDPMKTTGVNLLCNKCNNPRPHRSHHCKICNKCTLKMDHHCPWIANCVGYYNQKNFYQFLFYATFGDGIAAVLFLHWIMYYVDFSVRGNVPWDIKIKTSLQLLYYMLTPIMIIVGLMCSFSMAISIGTWFVKQTRMLLNNQTTIEKKMFENWYCSPYYINDRKRCFNSVMGDTCWDYFSIYFKGNEPFNPIMNSNETAVEVSTYANNV